MSIREVSSLNSFFLDFYINYGSEEQIEVSIPKGFLTSFTHKRSADNVTNSFNLGLIGDYSLDLEYKLVLGNKKVAFRYGWENETSKFFFGSLVDITPKFQGMMAVVSVSGVASLKQEDYVKRNVIWEKGTKFQKIIDLICGDRGWIQGKIVPATDLQENVSQPNETDVAFLSDILPAYIQSLDGGLSDYVLWFTYSESGKVIMNYAPKTMMQGKTFEYVYDLTGSANSKLISFTPSIKGSEAFAFGESLRKDGIDPETGQPVEIVINGDNEKVIPGRIMSVGSSLWKTSNTTSIVGESRLANKYWESMNSLALSAEAELIGEPTIEVGDVCKISVVLGDGSLHYSSGEYTVIEVEDTIASGKFTTKLSLVKNNETT